VASLPGYAVARREISLEHRQTRTLTLTLSRAQASVLVTSDPAGARVFVDGAARGATPLDLTGIPSGPHRIEVRGEGYVAADTLLEITAGTGQIHLALDPEPPGVLVVLGDHPAQIYVDDALVVVNVQNSGPVSLRAGTHQVRVVLVSGEVVERSVAVHARQRVTFDYSKNTVEREPGGSRGP
jgi:hypothetical protein